MVALPARALAGRGPAAPARVPPAAAADWIDGLLTSAAMLVPLGLAYREILRLSGAFDAIVRAPGRRRLSYVDLFIDHPPAPLPAWILAVPLAVWVVRRLLGAGLPGEPGLGRRAAGAGDLDGDPGVRARSSAGSATPPGGARPCRGSPTTTRSTPTAAGPCPISRSSISARPTNTASPGTTPGS